MTLRILKQRELTLLLLALRVKLLHLNVLWMNRLLRLLVVCEAVQHFLNKISLTDWLVDSAWCLCLCRGLIVLEGKSLVLEPAPGRSDGTHRIYSAQHLSFSPGTCGHGFNISSFSAASGSVEGSGPFRSFSSRVRVPPDRESSSSLSALRWFCCSLS